MTKTKHGFLAEPHKTLMHFVGLADIALYGPCAESI
jgi:hypothetical protein